MDDSSAFRRKRNRAVAKLRQQCPVLGEWIGRLGSCELLPDFTRSPYEALVRAVAHQQLHGRAAEAILGRLLDHCGGTKFPAPKKVLDIPDDVFRGFGFSRSKMESIRGIAQAALEKRIPTRSQAECMSNSELIEKIVELRGIGRWTVEMLLIFTLGRLDVFPADDFGVRAGLQVVDQLPDLPSRKSALARSSVWDPHGSVAAWYLWRVLEYSRKSQAR